MSKGGFAWYYFPFCGEHTISRVIYSHISICIQEYYVYIKWIYFFCYFSRRGGWWCSGVGMIVRGKNIAAHKHFVTHSSKATTRRVGEQNSPSPAPSATTNNTSKIYYNSILLKNLFFYTKLAQVTHTYTLHRHHHRRPRKKKSPMSSAKILT